MIRAVLRTQRGGDVHERWEFRECRAGSRRLVAGKIAAEHRSDVAMTRQQQIGAGEQFAQHAGRFGAARLPQLAAEVAVEHHERARPHHAPHSPTNGSRAASRSTRSRPATSPPATRRRCAPTPQAIARSSSAFPPHAGASHRIWVRRGVPRVERGGLRAPRDSARGRWLPGAPRRISRFPRLAASPPPSHRVSSAPPATIARRARC